MKAIEDLQPLINKLTAVGSLSGDNSYTSVSYTHLDVYKRQIYSNTTSKPR